MTATQTFTVMYAIEDLALDSTHDCAITAEDTVTYTLSAKQVIGHVNKYPTMQYVGNPKQTQSMITYMILTEYF